MFDTDRITAEVNSWKAMSNAEFAEHLRNQLDEVRPDGDLDSIWYSKMLLHRVQIELAIRALPRE